MPVPDMHVAVADPRRLDAQQHLLALGLGVGVVARFERLAPFDDLHRTHVGVPPVSFSYLRKSPCPGSSRASTSWNSVLCKPTRRGWPGQARPRGIFVA